MSSVIVTAKVPASMLRPCNDKLTMMGLEDMADGNSSISESLLQTVWGQFCQQSGTEDTGVTPCTFQGRIVSVIISLPCRAPNALLTPLTNNSYYAFQ
jgi:hypothetical protein